VVNIKESPLVMSALLVNQSRDHSHINTQITGQRSTQNERFVDLTELPSNEFPKLRRSLRKLMAEPENIISETQTTVNIRITQFYINVDYGKLVPENSIPIGFWRCLCEAFFKCYLSRLGPFKVCCQTPLCRVCRHRTQTGTTGHFEYAPQTVSESSTVTFCNTKIEMCRLESKGEQSKNNFEVSAQKPRGRDQLKARSYEADQMGDDGQCVVIVQDSIRSTSGTAEMTTKITWETVFKLIGLTTVLVVVIPAPFYARLAIYYFFEHDEVKRLNSFVVRVR